jgi:hypothetical protein
MSDEQKSKRKITRMGSKWIQARRELAEMGLLEDSGERDAQGQIVWQLSRAGREYFEALRLEGEPKGHG